MISFILENLCRRLVGNIPLIFFVLENLIPNLTLDAGNETVNLTLLFGSK